MNRHRLAARIGLAAAITIGVAGVSIAQDDFALPIRILANFMVVDSLPPGTAQVAVGGDASGGNPMGAPGSLSPPTLAPGAPVPGLPPTARSAPKTTAALMTITLDRVSTDDESAALARAWALGGFEYLESQMEETTVGYVQLNDRLRLPIRAAWTWRTLPGPVIRLATIGRIIDGDIARASGKSDDSIGIIELTLPAAGAGEGTLVQAIRVRFDSERGIVARKLALNTGTQRLTNVDRVAVPVTKPSVP